MRRKEALAELIAKVEAEELPDRPLVHAAFPEFHKHKSGWPIGRLIDWIMDPEDIRGMGAAKALHEAVLPGWGWALTDIGEAHILSADGPIAAGESDNPARAWLLSILRALQAMEADT